MAKADGSVIVDSRLNLSGFKNGVVNMQSVFGKLASGAKKLGSVLKSTFSIKSDGVERQSEIIRVSIDGMEKSVKSAMQKIKSAMSGPERDFDTIRDRIDTLSEHLKSLEAQGISFGYEEYDNAYKQLVLAEDELKRYKSELADTARAEREAAQEIGGFVGFLVSISDGMKIVGNAAVHILQTIGKAILNIPHWTINLVVSGLRKVGSVAKSAATIIGKGLVIGLKKLSSIMLGLSRNTKKTNGSLKSSLMTMLKYTLGIRSLYVLFNRLRSAIKDGFKNLAQYSSETNRSISMLMSSLTRLKNSLATAFNPILNAVAPALTHLIDLLSVATTHVGMFFAALTGKNTFVKAVAVQEDYAASLENTADAAKKANKYLSGLDEIRTYSEDKDSSAGGYTGPTQQEMFETVNIPSTFEDFAEKIKEAWRNADFTEIGTIVGTKLKNALDSIPWEPIKEKCNQVAQSLSTFINGFVGTPGLWESIGTTIGEGINTAVGMWNTFFDTTKFEEIGSGIATALNDAVETVDPYETGRALSQKIKMSIEIAYGFVTTFDWSGFGTWIGKSINGFFDNIDFSLAGKTLSRGIIGVFDGLTSAIEEVDWYGLGKKVEEFLVNIDWAGIFDSMFEAMGAALGGLAMFLWGLIENAWNSVVDWWYDTAYEDGQFTMSGLLEGIWEKIKNIGSWIKEHIFTPFVNGFKNVFGIHSPSTVMEEQGKFIMEGLLNGVLGMKDRFSEVFEKIVNVAKKPVNKIIEFLNRLISAAQSAWNTIANFLSFSIKIPDAIAALTGWSSFSLSVPKINGNYSIPYLATGAVIPPNAPFMAMLGDQKKGTNIETPEALLRKIVREESGNGGSGIKEIHIPISLSGRQIFEAIITEAQLKQMISGRNPFELA